MNQLDPELKRLIRWARRHADPSAAAPPFGFAVRVAAQARAELLTAEPSRPGAIACAGWRRCSR